ncbi:MAG: hypothetical protein L6R37_008187 [Teloschistes peruensis]|nr:MAG: hypothetical protein L6R37_008187 [Teloschistes peruensis]
MAAQRKNHRDWTPKEKSLPAAIQNDPEICNKTWEFKTDEFNRRVQKIEPGRAKRTMAAVYQQWKAVPQGQSQTQGSSLQIQPSEETVDGYLLNFDDLSAQERDEIFGALGWLHGES